MTQPVSIRRIVLAVTGASGMPYVLRLAEVLSSREDVELYAILSSAGRKVLEIEAPGGLETIATRCVRVWSEDELSAPPASGSWPHQGLVVCPCSMASLAAIAHGLGSNLLHRAADVTLKERRRLILVPRETPVSIIHLENMLAAARAGALILPACPGFYHRPDSIAALVDFVVARVLDHLDLSHDLLPPWGG